MTKTFFTDLVCGVCAHKGLTEVDDRRGYRYCANCKKTPHPSAVVHCWGDCEICGSQVYHHGRPKPRFRGEPTCSGRCAQIRSIRRAYQLWVRDNNIDQIRPQKTDPQKKRLQAVRIKIGKDLWLTKDGVYWVDENGIWWGQ